MKAIPTRASDPKLIARLFLAAAPNPFDLKAALLAGHAQHPVIVHFPIALFIASAVFEALAVWRKQPLFATVGCAKHSFHYRDGPRSLAMAT